MKKLLFILLSFTGISFAQIAETSDAISPLLIGEKIPKQNLISVDNQLVSTTEIFNKKTIFDTLSRWLVSLLQCSTYGYARN